MDPRFWPAGNDSNECTLSKITNKELFKIGLAFHDFFILFIFDEMCMVKQRSGLIPSYT